MLPDRAKGALQTWLRILSDGEMSLDFPGGSRVITEVLMREGRGRRARDLKTPHCWLWRWKKGPLVTGSRNQVASGSQKRQEGVVKVAQLCPTLCEPMDCIVHGILQARILEWVAFPFSRGSSQPRDWTQVSPLEPPEGTRPCECLDFSFVRPLLDFQPPEVYSNTLLLF